MRVPELRGVALEHDREILERGREADARRGVHAALVTGVELVVHLGIEERISRNVELRADLRWGGRRSRGRRCGRNRSRRRWWRRGRRGRRRSREIPDADEALFGNPLDVGAHGFGDDAERNDERALINLGRDVERARFAVDHDFGFADGDLNVGAGLGDVDGLRRRVVGHRSTHLLEHRTQGNKDRLPAY